MVIEPPSLTEALDLASRAVELTPLDPLASALAAWSHGMWATFTPRIAEARAAARVRADHAAQLRAGDATAEALLAGTYSMLHDLDAAELHVDRALALDGGCAWAWQRSGIIKIYRDRPVEAIECFQIAGGLELADSLRSSNSFGFAAACFAVGRYADSARWWKRGIVESPVALWANRFLAPACALSSRKDEALASLHALRRGFPEWDYDRAKSMLPHTDAFNDQVANGLESIGVRVHS
jgi:tetratricopeptide (TPR) repeat protein